jgi:hypothetical protein
MTKVEFKYDKTGKTKAMPEAHAKILSKLGRGTYMTRDMVAAPPAPAAVVSDARMRIATPQGEFDLTDMEKAELHDLAARLGVEVHHASGAPKVRAALMDAFPA